MSKLLPLSSAYVEQERRLYSLYVIQQRAIPSMYDGMKSAARRVLWTARDGTKYKSAALAGATMPIHPHAAPDTTINTLAMPYGNNIPLLYGMGTFGTRLKPGECGATRYTSVKISDFTKDVVFRDIGIIPMKDNYDNTLKEPVHFLPLVPISLLNPSEGIAVGFASTIQPRSLAHIVADQIQVLKGNEVVNEPPLTFHPFDAISADVHVDNKGKKYWTFDGVMERLNTTTVHITNLPYGVTHENIETHLHKLIDAGVIVDYTDDSSRLINITVKFQRGQLAKVDDAKLMTTLGIRKKVTENHVLIDVDEPRRVKATSYQEVIHKFTEWRLGWYIVRYTDLRDKLLVTIQRYRDVIKAITKNVGSVARKTKSRGELIEYLESINIVHTGYIADLPVYRFTEDEKVKVENKLMDAMVTLKRYELLIESDSERRKVYTTELREVLTKYGKK